MIDLGDGPFRPRAARRTPSADVIAPLRDEFPEAEFRVNQQRLEGLDYYRWFTLRISPAAPDGNRYAITGAGPCSLA